MLLLNVRQLGRGSGIGCDDPVRENTRSEFEKEKKKNATTVSGRQLDKVLKIIITVMHIIHVVRRARRPSAGYRWV